MFLSNYIAVAKTEFNKYYRRTFTMVAIAFFYLQFVALIYLDSHKFFASGNRNNISVFETVNSHFTSVIFSGIPLTLIITLSGEFSCGYAQKLISNGFPRQSFIMSKYLLGLILSIGAALVYCISIILFWAINVIPDNRLMILSLANVILVSFFFNIIVVSITLVVRSWQYSILIYYGYFFAESFAIYRFDEQFRFTNYFPFHLAISIFEFKEKMFNSTEFLSALVMMSVISAIGIIAAFHSFKKADL